MCIDRGQPVSEKIRPLAFRVVYEDAVKVRDWQDLQLPDAGPPDAREFESMEAASTLQRARHIGQNLLKQGNGSPRIYRLSNVEWRPVPSYAGDLGFWTWDLEFVEDV